MEWDRALDGVALAFGARGVMLHTADLRTGQILALGQGGPPMHEGILEYLREFHAIDPRRNHLLARGEALFGKWWHCHEHFDSSFVARDRFYQDFLPSLGTRYQSTLLLRPSEHIVTGFAIELPMARGVLSADERDVATRLGVHVHDALKAYQRVRLLAAQALAGHELLKNFAYPMWLIDAERFIHFENDAALAETRSEARLARLDTHLILRKNKANKLLTEQLHRLRSAPHGATAIVDMRIDQSDFPSWLHLSLLIPEAVFGAFGIRPLLLATLFDPQEQKTLDPFVISNILGMTPAQSAVASKLADGLTADAIATELGCSVATVRTHIRSVLSHLNASRIADVVRMLRQGETLWSGRVNSEE